MEDLRRWTGIPTFTCLQIIIENVNDIESAEKDLKKLKISVELLVVTVMVKLKMNFCFTHMSVLFNMHENKIAKLVSGFIPILAASLRVAIYWPSKEQNQANIPKSGMYLYA